MEDADTGEATFHRWDFMRGENWTEGGPLGAVLSTLVGLVSLAASVVIGCLVWIVSSWIWGAVVWLVLAAASLAIFRRCGVWTGTCPHCGNSVTVQSAGQGSHAFNCRICTKRVYLTGGSFRAV
jgi:hypothetical protein